LFIDSFFFIGQYVWDESESTEKEDMLAFDEVSLYASQFCHKTRLSREL
jgi:hypothetical protein